MPTNMGPRAGVASVARACGYGLAERPRRLSGLEETRANGAPHSAAGSITPAVTGLPFAARLAPRGEAGN
jgi:hypothetical protein